MGRFFYPIVFLIAVFGFVLGGGVESTFFQPIVKQIQTYQNAKQGQPSDSAFNEGKPKCDELSFKERLICDPISYYTRALTYVTGSLVAGTIVLAIFTWKIWDAGEKQRKISEDAVAAAREANEIIRSEQRPWVLYFDQVNWYRLPQEFNEATQEYGWPPAYRINLFKYGVRGAISFENYGKLPAYHVGMEVKPFFQQTGLPIPIPNWEDEVLLRDMNSIIAPSGHQSINCTIDAYNLGQMSRKVIDVFWFIRIWYCTNETIKPEIGSKDIRQTIYGFRITFESEGTLIGQSELVPVLRLHPIKGYSSAN